MKQASKFVSWITQLPDWLKTVGGLITAILAIVGIFSVYQENYYAFVLIVVPILFAAIILVSLYLILATIQSTIMEGRYLPKYNKYLRIGAGCLIFFDLIAGIGYYTSTSGRQAVTYGLRGTPTSTPTNTPTATLTPRSTPTAASTFTASPSPTPTPTAHGLYYMIVLDASAKMLESFETQTKWDAALKAVEAILKGFEAEANYGLVVIGNAPSAGEVDPCDEPSVASIPFSSRDAVSEGVAQIEPGGGGSLYSAFVLARSQFDSLPENTVRTLIYITGSEDACDSEDEWSDLERYFTIKGDEGLNIYSEIIIIDAQNGLRSQTIAERISSVSEKVNAQAPQTDFQLVQTNNIVINNVSNYVDITISAFPAPITLAFTPISTSTSIVGVTNRPPPAITAIQPTQIPPTPIPSTPIPPTPIPPTPIPSTQTPSQTAIVCTSTRTGLYSASYGGSVTINSPAPCSTDHLPGTPIYTSGAYSGIPQDKVIWVFVYPPNGPYYPQSPYACAGPKSPPPNQGGGSWDVSSYLGNIGDPPKFFDIVVAVTDQTTSDVIGQMLFEDCSNGFFEGISAEELSQMNIAEKAFITVRTR